MKSTAKYILYAELPEFMSECHVIVTLNMLFYITDPNFVNAMEIDDKIYFFLRETAVETIRCRKVSRKKRGELRHLYNVLQNGGLTWKVLENKAHSHEKYFLIILFAIVGAIVQI